MAEALAITSTYLSQIENNVKKPSGKLLKAIATFLDVPVSLLIFELLEEKSFATEEDKIAFLKVKQVVDLMMNKLLDESSNQTTNSGAKSIHLKESV